jgi:hypothetical protein
MMILKELLVHSLQRPTTRVKGEQFVKRREGYHVEC